MKKKESHGTNPAKGRAPARLTIPQCDKSASHGRNRVQWEWGETVWEPVPVLAPREGRSPGNKAKSVSCRQSRTQRSRLQSEGSEAARKCLSTVIIGLGWDLEKTSGRVDRNKAASAAPLSPSFHPVGLGRGCTDAPVAKATATLMTSSGRCLFSLQGVSGGLQRQQMRQARGRRRVQHHELQQLHGREERPPSPQHDHQREEGHRPRRYFGNPFTGCHPHPQSSELVVLGAGTSTSSPGTLFSMETLTWESCTSSLPTLQDSFPDDPDAQIWAALPSTGHIILSTLRAWFHG